MNRTARRRGWLALLLTGALFAVLPAAVATAETPIDPTIPAPALPGPNPRTTPAGADGCGNDSIGWLQSGSFTLAVPWSPLNGVNFQGAVHVWDVDGSQQADALAPWSGNGMTVNLNADIDLQDGHTYGWNASTYNGTAYSNPTATCYFKVDRSSPGTPTISNPDFPQVGDPGTPQKAAGQPTTFSLSSSGDTLPSGCTAAGTPDCQVSGLDHFLYSLDQPLSLGSAQVSPSSDGTAEVTMTPSWGVHTLYVASVDAVGNQYNESNYTFMVPWQLPPPAETVISLTAPAKSGRAAPLTLSGQLSVGSFGPGEVVHVTRTDAGHPTGVVLPDAALSADGAFQLTDTPQTGGANTYRVSYPGDATHLASSASATVQVSRVSTALTVSTNASAYAYSATAKVTAHLGTSYNSRVVSIYAQPYGGMKTLVKTGTVDSHGNLAVSYKVSRRTTFTATFAGDDRYSPATATRVAWAYAKVSDMLSSYYTSTHYGTTSYRVYHRTAKAVLKAAVTPDKARQCIRFQVQRYYGHTWHTVSTSGCYSLSTASTGYGKLTLTHSVDEKFRMRAEYVHSSKDTTNLSTWGAWQYFTVRR
ncbi:hypothetical protein ACEZCY_13190 [Streptacidiphilus sp. N1-12]|uniref:Ig-like domain (Group 3) n=2 Tax=Streptacidiphilus alkalitolerans TaxID=3342712 RepID=A0ABV6V909_9ACTN